MADTRWPARPKPSLDAPGSRAETRMGSFRLRLAVRFTALLVAAVALLGGGAFLSLRHIVYAQIDQTLLRLAEVEAAGTSDAPEATAHFHDNVYRPFTSEVSRGISRYAEIWTLGGRPVLRSQNLAGRDLHLPPSALRAAVRGTLSWFSFEEGGGDFRALVYPLSHGTVVRPSQVLEVAAPLAPAHEVLSSFLRILLLIGVVGSVGAFGGAWYFAGQAVRPVREIAEQAARLEPGRSAGEIETTAYSVEHRRLVTVLNDAFDRLQRAFEMQRQFTADAGHEIRTPLAIMQGDIEVALRRDRSPEEYRRLLVSALEEVRRLAHIADDLLTLAKTDTGVLPLEIQRVDMGDIVADVVRRYRPMAEDRRVNVDWDAGEGLTVDGDEDLLRRALGNVLENAVRYTPPEGRVGVSAGRGRSEGRPVVQIEVADNGPGIDPEDLARIFERFYRSASTRSTPGGSGLGLPIAHGLVRAHAGAIEVTSEVGRGTRVWLVIPAAPEPGMNGSASASVASRTTRSLR